MKLTLINNPYADGRPPFHVGVAACTVAHTEVVRQLAPPTYLDVDAGADVISGVARGDEDVRIVAVQSEPGAVITYSDAPTDHVVAGTSDFDAACPIYAESLEDDLFARRRLVCDRRFRRA